ncbi:hypothetical protein SM11_pC0078 (plasmid) [Sinorhizobium meliloti SM11]|uniref:Uncharacterized protein n=1 Tax=Sinorhizobium meliloti (strain SM11) TaxID=707241 RepID=F7XAW7_SINMM|nr:hypothetical protein SM11_pC0078 [Sinorhizobium meliloti SM11]
MVGAVVHIPQPPQFEIGAKGQFEAPLFRQLDYSLWGNIEPSGGIFEREVAVTPRLQDFALLGFVHSSTSVLSPAYIQRARI